MVTPDGFKPIPWPEVRKGDVLFHENGDRLTVTKRRNSATYPDELSIQGGVRFYLNELKNAGFTPYRRKPEMPTEPGAYLDKDGVLCELIDGRTGPTWRVSVNHILLLSPDEAAALAPFTRLVPMPTEEQVYEVVDRVTVKKFDSELQHVASAVMALLAGDKQEVES